MDYIHDKISPPVGGLGGFNYANRKLLILKFTGVNVACLQPYIPLSELHLWLHLFLCYRRLSRD